MKNSTTAQVGPMTRTLEASVDARVGSEYVRSKYKYLNIRQKQSMIKCGTGE